MYLAAALLVAACGPKVGKTTRVTGQFGDEVPESVRILVGESLDTTVAVTDGRFSVEIPTNLQELAYVQTDFTPVSFIADGSTITVDPLEGTAVSSNKKGPQSRYAAYDAWMRTFMTEYRSKMAGFGDDEDAAEEYFEQILPEYNEYQKETVRANGDNFLGVMALMQLMDDDPEEMVQGFYTRVEFTADGKVRTWMKGPEDISDEEIEAALASGELLGWADGMMCVEEKEWKEENGSFLYNSGEHREMFDEVQSPWDELTLNDDGLLPFGSGMMLLRKC